MSSSIIYRFLPPPVPAKMQQQQQQPQKPQKQKHGWLSSERSSSKMMRKKKKKITKTTIIRYIVIICVILSILIVSTIVNTNNVSIHFSTSSSSSLTTLITTTTKKKSKEWELGFAPSSIFSSESGIIKLCNLLYKEEEEQEKEETGRTTTTTSNNNNISITYRHCGETRIGNALSEYFFNRIIAGYAGIDDFHLNTSLCEQNNNPPAEENVFHLLGDTLSLNISTTKITTLFSSYTDDNDNTRNKKNDFTYTWKDACSSCMNDIYSNQGYPHECRNQHGHLIIPALKQEYQILTERIFKMYPYMISEIDDIVIHLRCLDVLTLGMPNMGLLPFYAYLELIHTLQLQQQEQQQQLKDEHDKDDTSSRSMMMMSIGIITAPFDDDEKSRIIVVGLQNFLQYHYPNAIITIRNSKQDTIPMVHTRLIKARYGTICTASTFCLLPTLAADGISILIPTTLYGGKHPNWVDKLPNYYNDIQVPMIRFVPSGNLQSSMVGVEVEAGENKKSKSKTDTTTTSTSTTITITKPVLLGQQLKNNDGDTILKILLTLTKEDYTIVQYDKDYDERISTCTYTEFQSGIKWFLYNIFYQIPCLKSISSKGLY